MNKTTSPTIKPDQRPQEPDTGTLGTDARQRRVTDRPVVTLSPLALRPPEAAAVLGIGERLLWERTNAGEIPSLKIGRCVLYSVDALREYLAAQSTTGGER